MNFRIYERECSMISVLLVQALLSNSFPGGLGLIGHFAQDGPILGDQRLTGQGILRHELHIVPHNLRVKLFELRSGSFVFPHSVVIQ